MSVRRKVAVITGVTGQDGSYLVDFLLAKGYAVHGVLRRSSSTQRLRLDAEGRPANQRDGLCLHYSELSDRSSLRRIINETQPDELYHLAGQSHVGLSFEIPESTCEFTAMGTLAILEIIRECSPRTRFLNIGSSEIFGATETCPQNSNSERRPTSPYGVAKGFAVDIVRVYRRMGLFAVNAICFNHESPRRGESFVTQKIASAAASIKHLGSGICELGNLDAQRDWGYAPEYVEAMWRMLQTSEPKDVVLATGQLTPLREFVATAFASVGLEWEAHVRINKRFFRPVEPFLLVGDTNEAEEHLGWVARTRADEVAVLMTESALDRLSSQD